MAIQLIPKASGKTLFCCSKWWGDPDLPPQVEYPMMEYEDKDGTMQEYPLTFICQIDCEDIAALDPEGRLPHEGMLYFFAAIDDFLGYESPQSSPMGRWDRPMIAVKYAKSINMETFNTCILVDDDDNPLAEKAMELSFERCEDRAMGHKLLGLPFYDDVAQWNEGCLNLLQIDEDDDLGIRFYDSGTFNFLIKESDLKYGNFKKTFGYLHSL